MPESYIPSDPHPVSTAMQAIDRARLALVNLHSKHDLVLMEDQTIEKKFGWVFFYTTRKYLESRNIKDIVPGLGPLIVERENGKINFLSTSGPPQAVIAAWERDWQEKHSNH